jgi:hypothetical protein
MLGFHAGFEHIEPVLTLAAPVADLAVTAATYTGTAAFAGAAVDAHGGTTHDGGNPWSYTLQNVPAGDWVVQGCKTILANPIAGQGVTQRLNVGWKGLMIGDTNGPAQAGPVTLGCASDRDAGPDAVPAVRPACSPCPRSQPKPAPMRAARRALQPARAGVR